MNVDELKHIKNDVLKFISKASTYENPTEYLLGMMTKVNYKVEFSAYFIVMLLIFLNRQGETIRDLTVNMINVSSKPIIQLSTFVGSVIGMIIQSASEQIGPKMVEFIKQFTDALDELNLQELNYLLELINEVRS